MVRRILTIAALVAACALPATGQDHAARPRTETLDEAFHVVRSGETLETITARYLGSSQRWRDNWKLNPELDDPHLIRPGQRLKILVPQRLPPQVARLLKASRRVEDQLRPRTWEDAVLNDLLRPRDAVRTYEASSAELMFFDETVLVVTEDSMVLIGDEPAAPARGAVDRQEIEIVRGQADLESLSRPTAGQEIEITLGGATATARSEGGGAKVQTRARRPEAGGAQVRVYGGQADVESAGAKVAVAHGMGTSVPEGRAPAPPEKLLPAPVPVQPADGAQVTPSASFAWQPVDGARAYVIEVCRDPRCGELEARATSLAEPRWSAQALPVRALYWRVTAVSPSGLDGYPSPATALSVVDRAADAAPPAVALTFSGNRIGFDERLVIGPGARLEVAVADDGSGVASWTPLLDGRPAPPDAWQGPWGEGESEIWTAGAHTAAVSAVDEAGNRFDLPPVAFSYDPDPPVLSWGIEGSEQELGHTQGGELDPGLDFREGDRGDWPWPDLTWTSSHVRWVPIGREVWTIRSDVPYIVVRADRKRVALPALGRELDKDSGLWIHAVDEGSGVKHLRYQVVERPGSSRRERAQVLLLEAVDSLGNTTRMAWPLGRASR